MKKPLNMSCVALALGIATLLAGTVSLNINPAIAGEEDVVLTTAKDSGWLGVTMQDVDEKMADAMQLKDDEGVLINSVVDDSPAQKAGLKEGDVITKFGDKEIEDTGDLSKAVRKTKPGEKVKLVIKRDGDEKKLDVVIGEREWDDAKIFKWQSDDGDEDVYMFHGDPEADFHSYQVFEMDDDRGYIGVKLEGLTEQLGEYFGIEDGEGALIAEVIEDGPAAKAGLKAGDVIVKLADEEIEDPGDIHQYLADTEEGDEVEVSVVRDKRKRNFKVTLDEVPDNFAWFEKGDLPRMRMPHIERYIERAPRMKDMQRRMRPHRQLRIEREFDKQEGMQDLKKELDELREELRELKKELHER